MSGGVDHVLSNLTLERQAHALHLQNLYTKYFSDTSTRLATIKEVGDLPVIELNMAEDERLMARKGVLVGLADKLNSSEKFNLYNQILMVNPETIGFSQDFVPKILDSLNLNDVSLLGDEQLNKFLNLVTNSIPEEKVGEKLRFWSEFCNGIFDNKKGELQGFEEKSLYYKLGVSLGKIEKGKNIGDGILLSDGANILFSLFENYQEYSESTTLSNAAKQIVNKYGLNAITATKESFSNFVSEK